MTALSNMLRGISGDFEVTRVMGAAGCLTYTVSAIGFEYHETVIMGHVFDVAAYCLALPGGLSAIIGSTAAASGYKEGKIAAARATQAATDNAGSAQ